MGRTECSLYSHHRPRKLRRELFLIHLPVVSMATEEVKSSSEIVITVGLNEDKLPVQLQWQAQSGQVGDCKALLLSLFDRETKETLKIDLWTLDMEIIEMDRFMFSTLRALADTYFKATSNKELSADFQRFVQYFGEQTEIIKP